MELRSSDVVPVTGLEPVRDLSQGILSPRCLPFHHTGVDLTNVSRGGRGVKSPKIARKSPEITQNCRVYNDV